MYYVYLLKQKDKNRIKFGETINFKSRVLKLEKEWGKFDDDSVLIKLNKINHKSHLSSLERSIHKFLPLNFKKLSLPKRDGFNEFYEYSIDIENYIINSFFNFIEERYNINDALKLDFKVDLIEINKDKLILPKKLYNLNSEKISFIEEFLNLIIVNSKSNKEDSFTLNLNINKILYDLFDNKDDFLYNEDILEKYLYYKGIKTFGKLDMDTKLNCFIIVPPKEDLNKLFNKYNIQKKKDLYWNDYLGQDLTSINSIFYKYCTEHHINNLKKKDLILLKESVYPFGSSKMIEKDFIFKHIGTLSYSLLPKYECIEYDKDEYILEEVKEEANNDFCNRKYNILDDEFTFYIQYLDEYELHHTHNNISLYSNFEKYIFNILEIATLNETNILIDYRYDENFRKNFNKLKVEKPELLNYFTEDFFGITKTNISMEMINLRNELDLFEFSNKSLNRSNINNREV